jgi:hypothetical protein
MCKEMAAAFYPGLQFDVNFEELRAGQTEIPIW